MGQLPAYHFQVEWGGQRIGCMEVSGLNITVDVIESNDGSSPVYSNSKMPGRLHYANIVLKRAIVKGDNDFFNWINTIQLNTVERRDITISLLDENHSPIVTWRAKNAFPVKLTGPVLNSNDSNVATEELEIAHEGITVVMS